MRNSVNSQQFKLFQTLQSANYKLDKKFARDKIMNVSTITKVLSAFATYSQSTLDPFQTKKTIFCIAHPKHLDFISFLNCSLFLAGNWPQTTMPSEKAYNFYPTATFPVARVTIPCLVLRFVLYFPSKLRGHAAG